MPASVQHYRHDYIQPPFKDATAFDVMHAGVLSCSPETSVRAAARALADHGVHALVVEGISEGRLVWRVFSDMDLVRAAREDKLDAHVSDFASADAATVDSDSPLPSIAQQMLDHGVTHVVVVYAGRPVGVVSTADIARAVAWAHE